MNVDLNALMQATDTTWGRSSTPNVATHSVKFTMQGDMLIATYTVVINFTSDRHRVETKRRHADEADGVVSAVLTQVKSRYKELSGKALKVREVSSTDNLEIIGLNIYSPSKKAYYRKKVTFEVS